MAGAGTYALLTDGSTVEIRPAAAPDAPAVRAMHAQMSPGNLYLRFFSLSPRSADREAQRVTRPPDAYHAALLAWLGGRLVGVASYEPTSVPGTGEVAFAVSDDMHHRGIATLLLEHLVSLARRRGLTAFAATTLLENNAMLRVFSDAGLPVRRKVADGAVELSFPLPGDDRDQVLTGYLDSVASRESRADVTSLRPVLAPESVAVIGASRRPRTVGRAILHNLVASGFAGRVYAVNPQGQAMEGIPCVPDAADLPEPVDLAVLTVPVAAVPEVAEACGRRGVRALVVITSGLGAEGADLLAICRRHGMRLLGPNCLGVLVPGRGLNATFAAGQFRPGVAGLVVQSGGVGIAVLQHLSRLGIGVSSFASVGDKYDVSSNDLLTWWEQDGVTRMAVLYVESFGSPRKFARTARRVGAQMPVLTVIGGRSPAGQRAAASVTAVTAAATPLVTQEALVQKALFGQAGIIATRSLGELIEAAALLGCQPLPAGRRVAIVSNAGSAGVLAADACADSGLAVARLGEATQSGLRGLLPAGAAVAGPVDTTPGVTTEAFRACLEQVAADEGVDAVLAVAVPTALSDLRAAVTAARLAKPAAAALLEQAEAVRLLSRGQPLDAVPAYAYPEGAARALGHAVRYRSWRDRQDPQIPDQTPEQGEHEVAAARGLTTAYLDQHPGGGWLPGPQAAELAACYQIPVADRGPAGVEVRARLLHEPVFGPLVMLGLGGTAADVLGGYAARLAPMTGADADDLIAESPAAGLLRGPAGAGSADPAGPADTAALAGLLLRVSRLADDLPEVAELELSPLIAAPEGARAAAIR
ncbi:MAG: GNAT family N-acetyltransferase, partial [Streptosporangiaceae bacterium]